jgi:hypothetical protein
MCLNTYSAELRPICIESCSPSFLDKLIDSILIRYYCWEIIVINPKPFNFLSLRLGPIMALLSRLAFGKWVEGCFLCCVIENRQIIGNFQIFKDRQRNQFLPRPILLNLSELTIAYSTETIPSIRRLCRLF